MKKRRRGKVAKGISGGTHYVERTVKGMVERWSGEGEGNVEQMEWDV